MRDKDVMMDDWKKDVQRLSQQLRRNLERERERERHLWPQRAFVGGMKVLLLMVCVLHVE